MHVQNLMNSLWDIRIFLDLVPKESPCIFRKKREDRWLLTELYYLFPQFSQFLIYLWPRVVYWGKCKQKETRQAKCVWRNIEASSCNHWCSGKEMNVTYSEWLFVALGIRHAIRMRHIVICALSGCTLFFHVVTLSAWFSKKKSNGR